MRFSTTAEIRGIWAWLFVAAWNLGAIATLIFLLPRLDLSPKVLITLGILAYVYGGLLGSLRAWRVIHAAAVRLLASAKCV